MIKRVLIACYLVLCAYFSFAQGGEVVLEIPMNLKSSYFDFSRYYGYLIENQEKNKYALLARDGSKVYLSLINSQFALEKNVEFPDLWDAYSDYPNFIVGYFEGTKYNFVFGDKRLEKFVVMSIDSLTQQATKVALEIKMDKNNNDFTNGIIVNGKCYLLFAKKAKSILDFYEIKNDFQIEKIEFDLDKDFPNGDLSKLFKEKQGFHALSYIDPPKLLNLFSTFSPNKLYTYNNQVILQIGKGKKIIYFDFDKHTYRLTDYKLPSFITPIEGDAHYNSMIYKDKLYQVNAHKEELVLSVSDLAQGNVIKEHRMIASNDREGEPNLKNSPYYQNEGGGDYAKPEIDNSRQFLRKISNAAGLRSIGGISIAINEMPDQKLYVMLGSITHTPQGGSGGGGMINGAGGVPMFIPNLYGGGSGGYGQQSFSIDTMLDLNTSDYIKTSTITSPFHRSCNEIKKQISNDSSSHAENILTTKEGFIFAYFSSKSKKFIFKIYQEKTK